MIQERKLGFLASLGAAQLAFLERERQRPLPSGRGLILLLPNRSRVGCWVGGTTSGGRLTYLSGTRAFRGCW